MVVRKKEYIVRGTWVHAQLQWIHDGDQGSKFFNFLKKKVVGDKVLSLQRADKTLEESPIEIRGMFSDHFKNIFSTYHLSVVAARDACYRLAPYRVSIRWWDRLDREFTKTKFSTTLS